MKRRYSWPLGTIAALVLVLIAIHLALPYLVRNYLNDKLANLGDYRGEIADVDLAVMLNRLILNGDAMPAQLVAYAQRQWQRPSVREWVELRRPAL